MKNNSIIKVSNLKKSYGDLTVLENISLEIYRGDIFVIAGGSGCGKSTLLRQIIGLEEPSSGEILIDGLSYRTHREEILKKFGMLFQSGGLFASLTLAENIALILRKNTNLSSSMISKIVDMKLEAVGLFGFGDYLPSEISGGMKKRASLARAITLDPEILFFDEPSSGLDPVTSAEMDELIKDLNSSLSTTMVIISHDLESIKSIAGDVILLDKSVKGILARGTPSDLAGNDNPIVKNFFNRKPSHS